jgi:hypothetical protein
MNINNYIKGEHFIELADNINIFYQDTHEVKRFLNASPKTEFILITHNSDDKIDDSYIFPDNLIHWFAQNVDIFDSRIESIPIGLENEKWFKNLHKKEKMMFRLETKKRTCNLVYLNCSVDTNRKEREPLYKMFKNKEWATIEKGTNGLLFNDYIYNLYNHKFVFCPEGNGIDTVRLWETLYMKSIPIVKNCINTSFYKDLPICFVDSWEEVTESFLNSEYERIQKGDWNMKKLEFDYWRDKILSYVSK